MGSKNNRTYKCPFCDLRFNRSDLVNHVTDNHEDELPEGFSPFRYVFHYVNKKPLNYHGICTECKGPTDWDEERGRYKRQCNKKACHDSYVKKFEKNMVKTRGVTRISSTEEGQLKMLKNRKISGMYKFANGEEKPYCGSYERKALEFMDQVLHIDPNDLMAPGPILEYKYDGKTHIYITDFYYQPYNLVIEVKDGGANPNKRNMPEYRAKQIEKEKFIIKHTNYNYLRLTDNNLEQLLNAFITLRMNMEENSGERVIKINEAMTMAAYAPVVGMRDSDQCVYIRNIMQNNVFSGYAIDKSYKFDSCFRIKNSKLVQEGLSEGESFTNTIVRVDIPVSEVSAKLSKYIGETFTNAELYYALFNKKMYTEDQIYEKKNNVFPSYETALKILGSIVENSIMDNYVQTLNESYTRNYITGNNLVKGKYHDICTESFGLDEEILRNFLDRLEV